MQNKCKTVLFLSCLVVFCVSGFFLGREAKKYAVENKRNRNLAYKVWMIREQSSEYVRKTNEMLPQYADLHQHNADLAGWLRVEGTRIDYPVMYRPEEPEYYLHRDFYGNDSDSGCLFISSGFAEHGLNTIIYGHHMGDGSMFAELLSYKEQEFADQHPFLSFDTCYEEGIYQVLAAFYNDIDAPEEKRFAYYEYLDLSTENTFQEYVSRVVSASVIDTNVSAAFGEELITLSTCSYHSRNGRFVVVAKKMEIPPS